MLQSEVGYQCHRVSVFRYLTEKQRALCWTASDLLSIEKDMRRIMGYQQLWILKVTLNGLNEEESIALKVVQNLSQGSHLY